MYNRCTTKGILPYGVGSDVEVTCPSTLESTLDLHRSKEERIGRDEASAVLVIGQRTLLGNWGAVQTICNTAAELFDPVMSPGGATPFAERVHTHWLHHTSQS